MKNEIRSRSELQAYARDLSGTRDYTLTENLAKLIAGDESVRDEVESALDDIDSDAAKHGE